MHGHMNVKFSTHRFVSNVSQQY